MRLKLACAVALLMTALTDRAARADQVKCDDAGAVAKLVKEANTAFGAERFADAAEGYAGAYACNHDASLLFNLGKADLKLGKWIEGLDAMRRFESESKDLPAEVRAAADEVIGELKKHVGTITVRSPEPGARVSIGGRDVGAAPAENVEVPAGHVSVEVSVPGHAPEHRDVDVAAGQHADLDLKPNAAPPPSEKPETKKVFHLSPLVWVGAATAGAGLIVALGTGIESAVETSDIKAQCNGNLCPASTEDARSKATALANASNAFIAIGAAGAVVGVVGIFLSGKREEPVTTSLVVGPTGVSLRGRF